MKITLDNDILELDKWDIEKSIFTTNECNQKYAELLISKADASVGWNVKYSSDNSWCPAIITVGIQRHTCGSLLSEFLQSDEGMKLLQEVYDAEGTENEYEAQRYLEQAIEDNCQLPENEFIVTARDFLTENGNKSVNRVMIDFLKTDLMNDMGAWAEEQMEGLDDGCQIEGGSEALIQEMKDMFKELINEME